MSDEPVKLFVVSVTLEGVSDIVFPEPFRLYNHGHSPCTELCIYRDAWERSLERVRYPDLNRRGEEE